MSVNDLSQLILLLFAVCTIEVICNTTLPTEEREDLSTGRCSFLDTYTRQVETTWTSSNISSAWEKLHVQSLKDYVTIGNFSRKILNAQWDFEIQLETGMIVISTNVKILQRDGPLNNIRVQGIADIGSATKTSRRFSDLRYRNFREEEKFTGYSFIWMTNEEFGNMSDIVSLNVTAELVYAKAVQLEALDCQNNQSVSAGFVESKDTSEGFNLPLPVNKREEKIRTIYEWTIQRPRLDLTPDSYGIAETGGFRIGYGYDAVRWEVNLEIWKFEKWQEVALDIFDHSSRNLDILKNLNVTATLAWSGTSRKMDLRHTNLDFVKHFKIDLSDEDLKQWEDSLTVVMTFDPVESIHSTTNAYFR